MTANQLAYARLQEEQRSNLAKEAETYRSDVEQERIKKYSAQHQAGLDDARAVLTRLQTIVQSKESVDSTFEKLKSLFTGDEALGRFGKAVGVLTDLFKIIGRK